jgi:hypothetical protein
LPIVTRAHAPRQVAAVGAQLKTRTQIRKSVVAHLGSNLLEGAMSVDEVSALIAAMISTS